MFGMKRRAAERAAKKAAEAAEWEAVTQTAHTYLVAELRDTVEWLIASHNLAGRANTLLTKAEAIRGGIDAVLVNGLEAFGPELKDEDQPVRGGAMVANGKRNMLLLTGAFDRAETRGDFCSMLGFSRDGSAMREPLARQEFDDAEYERGCEAGQEAGRTIATAVDEMMKLLVTPWADDIIDIFTKRVTMKVIFCDEDPEREARFSLSEFAQEVDEQLRQIRPDVRAKLSAYEKLSHELDCLDEFETLLRSRFDIVRHDVTMKAVDVAQSVVMARNEELGLGIEDGECVTNGRKILKDVREMPVSLQQGE